MRKMSFLYRSDHLVVILNFEVKNVNLKCARFLKVLRALPYPLNSQGKGELLCHLQI